MFFCQDFLKLDIFFSNFIHKYNIFRSYPLPIFLPDLPQLLPTSNLVYSYFFTSSLRTIGGTCLHTSVGPSTGAQQPNMGQATEENTFLLSAAINFQMLLGYGWDLAKPILCVASVDFFDFMHKNTTALS